VKLKIIKQQPPCIYTLFYYIIKFQSHINTFSCLPHKYNTTIIGEVGSNDKKKSNSILDHIGYIYIYINIFNIFGRSLTSNRDKIIS